MLSIFVLVYLIDICRYLDVLLRRVSMGHVVYSPNYKAFVSLAADPQFSFQTEEYADLTG